MYNPSWFIWKETIFILLLWSLLSYLAFYIFYPHYCDAPIVIILLCYPPTAYIALARFLMDFESKNKKRKNG